MPDERLVIEPARSEDMNFIRESVTRFRLDDEDLQPSQFLVARSANRMVAFGRIKPYRQTHELGCIAVLEAWRHRGLGRCMVEELVRRFPEPTVWITTDLVDYFSRLGFRVSHNPPTELREKLSRVEGRIRHGVVAMSRARDDAK